MSFVLSQHASERMTERGLDEIEVNYTIMHGEAVDTKFGRFGFRSTLRLVITGMAKNTLASKLK